MFDHLVAMGHDRTGDIFEGWTTLAAMAEATRRLRVGAIVTSNLYRHPGLISALRLEPGMRVLEIGTGTGWNAECLAALGAEVVSVKIDAVIAEQARISLQTAGYGDVVVVTGTSEHGALEHAHFDRVLATAAVHSVPYA